MAPNDTFITGGPGGPGIGGIFGIDGRRGDVHVNYIYGPGSSAAALLMSFPRADYARHDSGRKDAPLSCLEGTRVDILAEIMSWLENANEDTPPIYWLNGLAGIGKSTIAKTIAERAEEIGMLGASFFFSRSDAPLCDPQRVFPTVALQLAQSGDAFQNVIMEAVQQDPTVGHKKLLPQLQGLILTPLLKLNPNRRAVLIILDALDECEENGAAEILRLLFSLGTRIPFLRFLITSRPEPHISFVFDEALNHAKRVLHDIETSVIQQDIRFYLDTELAKIPRRLRLDMGVNWASEDEVNSLVESSGKLFIYAATSIRFIGDDRVRDPGQQLRLVLSTQTTQEVGATPYTQLDNLYMGVLRNSLSDSNRRDILERFQIVVGSVVLLREPLPLRSLAQFVPYEMDEIDSALYHLQSIIISPSNDDEAPRIYHPSFRDFITDASRCSDAGFVIVPVPGQERRHAIRCFQLVATFLKRDVAGISDPSLLNSEVDGFEQKVRGALSPEVRYACRYWASHLSYVVFKDEVAAQALDKFSTKSILWWLEAMSLIDSISTAISSIQQAYRWAMNSKCKSTLVTMLADARRFILAHGEVIRASAPHVYQSALPFTPHDTALYKTYWREADHSICVVQGVESQWPQSLSSLLGHSDGVKSVAYSPDGLRLASGSLDNSVRLWDAMSGAPIATLDGHSDYVWSVTFSPNGLQLASGSRDRSVRLWDAISGMPIATLEGHLKWVTSVAYSPDGLRLASGSWDRSVRLWDAMSGAPIATLEGHSALVFSVAFSPDGLRLASGSRDCSVRLWNAVSGAPIATLEGNSEWVWCIAFSPNGLRLASGSRDNSVQLWDAVSGTPIATLVGHSGPVYSVAYSPDGLRLASGSEDNSVRLWDAMSGAPVAILEGHSTVFSVAFSPDGLRLASASGALVRLWDAVSSAPIAMLEGHSEVVCSIAFSPNGLRLASGSEDSSVRLWDAMSGAPAATLEGHSGPVSSVAFSPGGLQVASGSYDNSVRLWDVMSGVPIATLEGHSQWVSSVAFVPDGLRLASGSWDHSVRLWDVVFGMPIATLEGHSNWVGSVAFSPDGFRLASGSADHSVRLWDAMLGSLVATLDGHSEFVVSVAFSPDSLQLASGSDDGSVRLWDVTLGTPIATLEGHSSRIQSIAFSINAQTLTSNTLTEAFAWDLTLQPPCHLDSESSLVSSSSSAGLLPLVWSRAGQWIQVQRPPEYRVRRVCHIPPFYTPCTSIEVPSLQNSFRVAVGCEDGHVIILDTGRHPLCI